MIPISLIKTKNATPAIDRKKAHKLLTICILFYYSQYSHYYLYSYRRNEVIRKPQ